MKRLLTALLLTTALPPLAAGAPVTLYPLDRVGEDEDVAVVSSLLDAAVHQAARRSDVRAADPLVARASCGAAATAQRACLARVAGRGIAVRAAVRRSPGILVVTLEAVDASARSFGPLSVGLETAIQNSEPLTRALVDLAERAEAAPALATAPAAPAPHALAAAPAAAKPPATAPVSGAPLPPARSSWQAATAPWLGAAGVVLATVGAMYAASGQTLSEKLDRKHAAGSFSDADLYWEEQQDRYDDLSKKFLVAGAAAGAAGLALWMIAPSVAPVEGGAAVGVSGKF